VAAGRAYGTAALQAPESVLAIIALGHVIEGDSASVTVTVNEQLAELPALSEAVPITVVVPTEKVLPLGISYRLLVTLQLSVAVGRA
jgi:hypothetical protein